MAERVPPEIQQYLLKYQQLQAQLNQILTEKAVLQQELREIERALSVLKDVPDDAEVFRSSGHVMVKVSKNDVVRELNDRKELIDLRIKTLERQESLLRQQLAEVQGKLTQYASILQKKQQ